MARPGGPIPLDRRKFLQLALSQSVAAQTAAKKKPNIVLVLADDLGFSDIGCYGGEIATPLLDSLAAGGLRFTQMYSTARCWPSRSCLMTGYYPQQIGRDSTTGPFPAWARFTPQYLRLMQYRTYHAGKWHVTGKLPIADAQFHRSYSLEDHDRNFNPRRHNLDDKPLPAVAPNSGYYTTTAITDRALTFLDEHHTQHKDESFFLYLCYTSPHFPLHARPEDIAEQKGRYNEGWDVIRKRRWERLRKMRIVNCPLPPLDGETIPNWNLAEAKLKAQIGPGEVGFARPWEQLNAEEKAFQAMKMELHAAMVTRIDKELARLADRLKTMGAWENTLILFASDNGASAEQMIRGDMHDPAAAPGSAKSYLCLGPGWSTAANTPMKLHKHWNHEGGISSPFIAHWPAGIRDRGKLRHAPAHFIDFVPTLLELTGAKPDPQWKGLTPPPFPGKSLLPVFAKDVPISRDYIFFHHTTNRGLRVGDWKISAAGPKGAWELYDLKEDRSETKNLAATLPDKVKELAAIWDRAEAQFLADNQSSK
jgi:arylsulfatase A-like enzyme